MWGGQRYTVISDQRATGGGRSGGTAASGTHMDRSHGRRHPQRVSPMSVLPCSHPVGLRALPLMRQGARGAQYPRCSAGRPFRAAGRAAHVVDAGRCSRVASHAGLGREPVERSAQDLTGPMEHHQPRCLVVGVPPCCCADAHLVAWPCTRPHTAGTPHPGDSHRSHGGPAASGPRAAVKGEARHEHPGWPPAHPDRRRAAAQAGSY